MGAENAITVEHLTKRYDGFTLKDVSFQVPAGSIVGFIGENGAGKSTTIKAVLGLIPVDGGQVQVLGHKISAEEKDAAWKEQIGVVFDECNIPLGLKVKDVRNMMKNIYHTWEDEKFRDYMERFEIPMNKRMKELSKGMKMKLSIAVALSHDSRLLVLDEATSGLDPVVRNEILDIFREFIEDEQHTIFISSHITSDIEKIADYVMLIHRGQILFSENKDELLYNYGIVRCGKRQAERIPKDIVVGKEEREYETSVLIKDKKRLEESGFFKEPEDGSSCAVDRATIEDMLLYIVKSKEQKR